MTIDRDKLIQWLESQINACNKLLEYEEANKNDSTILAEHLFHRAAYKLILQKIQENLFDNRSV